MEVRSILISLELEMNEIIYVSTLLSLIIYKMQVTVPVHKM